MPNEPSDVSVLRSEIKALVAAYSVRLYMRSDMVNDIMRAVMRYNNQTKYREENHVNAHPEQV